MAEPRRYHWPHGPYPVHADSADECKTLWCLLWNRHEFYGGCACGQYVRGTSIAACSDGIRAHIADQRRQLAGGVET